MYPKSELSIKTSAGFTMQSFYLPDRANSKKASVFKFAKPEDIESSKAITQDLRQIRQKRNSNAQNTMRTQKLSTPDFKSRFAANRRHSEFAYTFKRKPTNVIGID